MVRKLCNREKKTTFGIADKKLYLSVITISTHDETILLKSVEMRMQTHNWME